MRIRRLRAAGWRNLEPLDLPLEPAARLTVLYGDNGQGKTNALEALYYLATLRSFRTTQSADLVRVGAAEARIGAELERGGLVRNIEVRLALAAAPARTAAVRTVAVDGKNARGVAAVLGTMSVVLFVPEDLLLPRGAPAARRRFLDMAVFGVERPYFAEAAAFQKLLRSRNALLRDGSRGRPAAPTLLDTYDEQLAAAGARVVARRRRLVAALAPHVQRYFQALHADLAVELAYVSELDADLGAAGGEPALAEALLAGLRQRRTVDSRRGHTTFGPQHDDLEIRLGGRPARAHASQGQLRSLVLALKLAEVAHVEACLGEAPALLLDDVPSELDPGRRQYLFTTLAALDCQTVISVADRSVVPALAGRVDHFVERGVLGPADGMGFSSLQRRT